MISLLKIKKANQQIKEAVDSLEKELDSRALSLADYIMVNHGKACDFATTNGVKRQQVTKWKKSGYIVVGGVLY